MGQPEQIAVGNSDEQILGPLVGISDSLLAEMGLGTLGEERNRRRLLAKQDAPSGAAESATDAAS